MGVTASHVAWRELSSVPFDRLFTGEDGLRVLCLLDDGLRLLRPDPAAAGAAEVSQGDLEDEVAVALMEMNAGGDVAALRYLRATLAAGAARAAGGDSSGLLARRRAAVAAGAHAALRVEAEVVRAAQLGAVRREPPRSPRGDDGPVVAALRALRGVGDEPTPDALRDAAGAVVAAIDAAGAHAALSLSGAGLAGDVEADDLTARLAAGAGRALAAAAGERGGDSPAADAAGAALRAACSLALARGDGCGMLAVVGGIVRAGLAQPGAASPVDAARVLAALDGVLEQVWRVCCAAGLQTGPEGARQ